MSSKVGELRERYQKVSKDETVPVRLLEHKVIFDRNLAEGHPRMKTMQGFKIVDAVIDDAYFGKSGYTDSKGNDILGLHIDVNYGNCSRNGALLYMKMEDMREVLRLLCADRADLLKGKKVIVYKDDFFRNAVALAVEDSWVL